MILSTDDPFLQDLTPEKYKVKFVDETNTKVQEMIQKLGGKKLGPGEYACTYVVPFLPQQVPAIQLPLIRRLLDQLVGLRRTRNSHILGVSLLNTPLIPDRTGRLRRGRELYNPTNQIFASSFLGYDTAFPHESMTTIPLN